MAHSMAVDLFGPALPDGARYRDAFVSETEETALFAAVAAVTFSTFEMRGIVARRRVAFFGETYGETAAPPIPDWLLPLRARLAEWASVAADDFTMALINEYPSGAPIGWHRDAPQYGIVAGVSLLSECRMRFRPYRAPSARGPAGERRAATHEVVLARRSAYLITGAARWEFEHHVPPVTQLRYSVTFRTRRA